MVMQRRGGRKGKKRRRPNLLNIDLMPRLDEREGPEARGQCSSIRWIALSETQRQITSCLISPGEPRLCNTGMGPPR